jgi:hypothetical protein
MLLHDLNEFLRLSEVLNLQLSVKTVGWSNIASVLMFKKKVPAADRDMLLQVLHYLEAAYGQRRRRLGPLAVLHPLRATTLLARAMPHYGSLDLLTSLLHDKLEDLTPENLGQTRWRELEVDFQALLKSIDPEDEWLLMERLDWLSRRTGETYSQYVNRLLEQSQRTPEIVRIKLADRLDNTLDMHVYIEDPLQKVDFYATIFKILYINSFGGHAPELDHAPPSPLSGAERLYQLFKNVLLLSLVRQAGAATQDEASRALFEAVALASVKEAQRIILHIFAYHLTDTGKQRQFLLQAMEDVQQSRLHDSGFPKGNTRLDEIFLTYFEVSDSARRRAGLADLYQNKGAMVEAGMAFVIIFQNFLNDQHYSVQGIR